MKKIITAMLSISLLMTVHGYLMANHGQGAEIIIQRKDGQLVRGELIAVKKKSLLIQDSQNRLDETIKIMDVKLITVEKKAKILRNSGLGLITGAAGGVLGTLGIYEMFQLPYSWGFKDKAKRMAIISGVGGMIAGGILGIIAGIDEPILLEGKSELEIKEILEKLHKKARISDFN